MALRITKKQDKFARLIAHAPKRAREIEKTNCELWADVMRQIMPVLTGAMRDSTKVVTLGNGRSGIEIGVSYYMHVNDGTVYQEGQHFIEESREFIRDYFVRDIRRFAVMR